ncbi:hypothetical protein GC173_00440 [bacterium]|nr:hypothetical protein [bacterium]
MKRPLLLGIVLLGGLAISSCGEEKAAPAKDAAGATAAPKAEGRTFRFELGEHVVELTVPPPAQPLTAEGEKFYYYQNLREASIREYLAQQFDAASKTWDSGKVKKIFEENWAETKAGFDRMRQEVEAQGKFLDAYLEEKKSDAALKATDFYTRFEQSHKDRAPFESVTEWDRFAKMFPTSKDVQQLVANIPQTVEEAWKIHGPALTAQSFGDEWTLGELRKRDPEAEKKLGDKAGFGTLFPESQSTMGRLNSPDNTRAQVMAELRNRIALANLLESIKFTSPEDQKLFTDGARKELQEPLPQPLESVKLIPDGPVTK